MMESQEFPRQTMLETTVVQEVIKRETAVVSRWDTYERHVQNSRDAVHVLKSMREYFSIAHAGWRSAYDPVLR